MKNNIFACVATLSDWMKLSQTLTLSYKNLNVDQNKHSQVIVRKRKLHFYLRRHLGWSDLANFKRNLPLVDPSLPKNSGQSDQAISSYRPETKIIFLPVAPPRLVRSRQFLRVTFL